MKRKTKIVLGLGVLFLSALLTMTIVVLNQEQEIRKLSDSITGLKASYTVAKFMILSRSDTEVSARIKLYNAEGAELAMIEKAWAGDELYLDFYTIPVKNAFLFFPYRIFTNKTAPRSGTMLFSYYTVNNFPAVYADSSLTKPTQETIQAIYQKVVRGEVVTGSFGSTVHDVKEIGLFTVGVVYDVIARSSGGIEIIEE